jgi:ADP-dependent NAD(P)H-hydrate dehydratase / NAD(P)H-hydrate epimerase
MIPVLTVSQMRDIDERAIAGNLTIGYSLMVKAGIGLCAAVKELMNDRGLGEIAIFCGKGNNGGDGYVAGRMLLDAGYKVMCFSLCETDELLDESKVAFNEYCARKGNVLILNDTADVSDLSRFRLIIDAMLGTGLKGDPRGLYALVIEAVNACGVPVIAVDTPSGLNNDTGIPGNPCIRATTTVTMGYPKIGLYFYPGKAFVGKLIIQDLSYPDEIVAGGKLSIFYPSFKRLRKSLPSRHPDGSKIDHGLALLICGSKGMTGSAALVAEAALRSGCGMVHLASAESLIPVLSIKLTEPVLHPLYETTAGSISFSSIEQIRELSINKNALCIGPGLTHDSDTTRLVREVIKSIDLPAVLDADGLNAFKEYTEELKDHAGTLVITPHRGEWVRLFGALSQEPSGMIEQLKSKSDEYKMTILLKGNPTLVVDSDGTAYILPYGNSALATAGTGDVLSGIIVSLIAQGATALDAAILGSYIQGEAGTIASKRLGEHSVIARDVVGTIYRVIKRLC